MIESLFKNCIKAAQDLNKMCIRDRVKKYHIDPEDGRDDESMGQVGYPVQKIIQFGVNLTF